MFFASDRKKKQKEKQLPLYNNQKQQELQSNLLSLSEMEQEVINAQKRNLIVEILRQLIKLMQSNVNDKLKPLIAHTNI